MIKSTHNDTVRSDDIADPGYVRLSCAAFGLPDNTSGKTGWHVCYAQYQLDTLPSDAQAAVREHWAAPIPKPERKPSRRMPEWRSERGLTLAEEMDREDTIY